LYIGGSNSCIPFRGGDLGCEDELVKSVVHWQSLAADQATDSGQGWLLRQSAFRWLRHREDIGVWVNVFVGDSPVSAVSRQVDAVKMLVPGPLWFRRFRIRSLGHLPRSQDELTLEISWVTYWPCNPRATATCSLVVQRGIECSMLSTILTLHNGETSAEFVDGIADLGWQVEESCFGRHTEGERSCGARFIHSDLI
jgi:hypothetical protein